MSEAHAHEPQIPDASADAAARLIERLLSDGAFRARFRRDPVGSCRALGLDDLAEEMGAGAGKALHTLDLRESKSSLAGVMMAAAVEGMAAWQVLEHLVPAAEHGAGVAIGAVGDVLSRVSLPAIGHGPAAASAAPAVHPAAVADASAAAPGASPTDAAAAPADAAATTPAPVADDLPDAGTAPAAGTDPAAAGTAPAAAAPAVHAAGASAAAPAADATAPAASAAAAPAPAAADAATAAAGSGASHHWDPDQFGQQGMGGPPDAETLALLDNPKVTFDESGIGDLKGGKIDPRIVAVLTEISHKHSIVISCMSADHPEMTTGGSMSNHSFGRGIDIASVDGVPIGPGNEAGKEVAQALSSLDASIKPSEIGSPWALSGPEYFTDGEHQDHLHVAFDDPITPDWKPPADVAAPAAAAGTAAVADPAAAAAAAPLVDPATGAPVAGAPAAPAAPAVDTMTLATPPVHASAAAAGHPGTGTLTMRTPDAAAGGVVPADAAAGGVAPGAAAPVEAHAAGASAVDPAAAVEAATPTGPNPYPGDGATKAQFANWMANEAQRRGLPRELPVMASLVESGLTNIQGGDRDSIGFFQMRTGIWNSGDYTGFPKHPELQIKWFLDQAEQVKEQRVARGQPIDDPQHFGDWIADVERPAEQYRGRYQLQLQQAQTLLPSDAGAPAPATPADAAGAGSGSAAGAASAADATAAPATPGAAAEVAATAPATAPVPVEFDPSAPPADLDPRLQGALTQLAAGHKLTIAPSATGTTVDITAIDGRPVNGDSIEGRALAEQAGSLDASVRPASIGSPWTIDGASYTSGAGHQDHLELSVDPASGAPADPAAAAPAAPVPAAAGAATPAAPAAAPAPSDTLSLRTPDPAAHAASASPGGGSGTLRLPTPTAPAGAAASAAAAPADVAGAAAGAQAAAAGPGGAGQAAAALVDGAGSGPQAGAKALAAMAAAKGELGVPYLWGGTTTKGFDCSGLMQWAYAKVGIQIPRVAADQALAANGHKIDRQHLMPGDLVFFSDSTGYVHHVGMAIGGDKFIEAPHTGANVRISSLNDPYYAQQFSGGRRFDAVSAGGAAQAAGVAQAAAAAPAALPGGSAAVAPVDPTAAPAGAAAPAASAAAAVPDPNSPDVQAAQAAVARDAAAVKNPDSMVFKAITAQEASHHRSQSLHMMAAVTPEQAQASAAGGVMPADAAAGGVAPGAAAPVEAHAAGASAVDPAAAVEAATPTGPNPYPGDGATKAQFANWMANEAQRRGLPRELPVMASLVESGLTNIQGGDRDSIGFFQMRTGIWNSGDYTGFPKHPELQIKWFLDQAEQVKEQRVARGQPIDDPQHFGDWIADVERPAEQYRGRYQLQLQQAQTLLK